MAFGKLEHGGCNLAHILKAPHPPSGPLVPEMAEQTEPAVITPAMLEEEEQLEAAGLEKERKMLEEVMPHDRRLSLASSPPAPSVPSPLAWLFLELQSSPGHLTLPYL